MTKTKEELTILTTALAFESTKDNEWCEIKKVNLAPLPFNPYAYIDIGKVLSNGEREKETKTIVVYWDGSNITRSRL